MLVKPGEKVHVVTRRQFEDDVHGHFVGEIMLINGTAARLQGYAFIFDTADNQFTKKPEVRTTIVDLAESGYIVNIIPHEVHVDDLTYTVSRKKRLILSDGKDFELDIHELGANG